MMITASHTSFSSHSTFSGENSGFSAFHQVGECDVIHTFNSLALTKPTVNQRANQDVIFHKQIVISKIQTHRPLTRHPRVLLCPPLECTTMSDTSM